jgi:hypothetical protein
VGKDTNTNHHAATTSETDGRTHQHQVRRHFLSGKTGKTQ